jgi:hypothetical protein
MVEGMKKQMDEVKRILKRKWKKERRKNAEKEI